MGKINGCLKCLFIFFNVLFALIGCLLIYAAVRVTAYSLQLTALGAPGLGWLWLFAIGVLSISSLGIYAACAENSLALKIFAGFMVAGMIIMLIFGIIVAVLRNKIKDAFDSASAEMVKPFMENEEMKQMLDALQQAGHCCGVVKSTDWGQDIPASCACSGREAGFFMGSGRCKQRPAGTTGPDQIYDQTCGDLIFSYIDMVLKVTMGFLFGFAVTALLGLLVSLLMVRQVSRHEMGGAMAMKSY